MSKLEIARLVQENHTNSHEAQSDHQIAHPNTPTMSVHDKEVQADDGVLEKHAELNERLIAEIKSLKVLHKGQQEKSANQLADQLQTINALKKELKDANSMAGLLKEELERMEKNNNDRLKEIAFLKKELDKSQSASDNIAKSTSDSANNKLKELEKLLASVEQEKSLYMTKCKQHEDKIAMLQTECSQLEHAKAALGSQKPNPSCCDTIRRELESCKKTLTVAKEELLCCKDQLYDLKKQAVNQEYLRNVIVSFLSIPSQRAYMLEVLCRLLDLTDAEKSKINVVI